MTQVAVVNQTGGLADDKDIAFWVDGVNQQAKQVAGVWGVPYTPVVFYSTSEGLPSAFETRLLTIQSTMDVPGALGYHDDELGIIFARILFTGPETSITISHEVIEEMIDPEVNLWDPFDATREQAREGCDRCEGDSYFVPSSIMGETRQVPVSNWLLPSAFGIGGQAGPWDFMGTIPTQNGMSPGGYTILRDKESGKLSNIYARARAGARIVPGGPAAAAGLVTKLSKPGSRLLRRLRG